MAKIINPVYIANPKNARADCEIGVLIFDQTVKPVVISYTHYERYNTFMDLRDDPIPIKTNA